MARDDIDTDLIDATGLTLRQVEALDDSALGDALRRILETDQAEPSVGGFAARL